MGISWEFLGVFWVGLNDWLELKNRVSKLSKVGLFLSKNLTQERLFVFLGGFIS